MTHPERRRDGLLASRAVGGLSPDEGLELDRLLAAHPPADPEAFERTAALLHLALCAGEDVALPEGLADRIAARLARERSTDALRSTGRRAGVRR